MMATAAYQRWNRADSLTWVRNLLREELAPYPGRYTLVARMLFAATLDMVINMTFQVPFGNYGAVYTLTLSRENPQVTLQAAKTLTVSFSFAAVYTLVGAIFFSGDPVLRLLWVFLTLFLIFFGLKVVSNYTAAASFGFLLAATIPIWDQPITAEQKVVQTLWAVASVSIASAITVLVEFIYARTQPVDAVTSALVERLRWTVSLLRSLSRQTQETESENQVVRLAILGTSRMRQDLLRSSDSSEVKQQIGATIAMVGRLIDLAANLAQFRTEMSSADLRRLESLATRIESLSSDLNRKEIPDHPSAAVEAAAVANIPILGEMERNVSLISEVLAGFASPTSYLPSPQRQHQAKQLLVPDAFSNPDYLRFAIRGGLAASLCYLLYNLIAWQGISTAVTTCVMTALTTIGASRQKQILRFGGAVVGGVILGIGAQVFVLPALDSIAGFLVLFVVVSALAAWIATSGPRLSYFGAQTAVAFYLINLQEFKFQTSLSVARDRVAGILLGLIAMWLIFDQLWGASAVVEMQRTFVSTVRLLATLMKAPTSNEPASAIEETYVLRDRIGSSFENLRQHADGVMLELGKTRERDLALRSKLLRWQLRLRELFSLRLTLLRYRLHLPGFELPDSMRRAQEAFDIRIAKRLEAIADKVSVPARFMPAEETPDQSNVKEILDVDFKQEEDIGVSASRTLVPLLFRLESLLISLEQEIEVASV
jgi:multidrug resistance protein MdtO